jgi:uncharacterized MnhB-related membrane protein
MRLGSIFAGTFLKQDIIYILLIIKSIYIICLKNTFKSVRAGCVCGACVKNVCGACALCAKKRVCRKCVCVK